MTTRVHNPFDPVEAFGALAAQSEAAFRAALVTRDFAAAADARRDVELWSRAKEQATRERARLLGEGDFPPGALRWFYGTQDLGRDRR